MSRILMVASEATPFAKTGGLADVIGALPQALRALGDEVGVVLPRYRGIALNGAQRLYDDVGVWLGPSYYKCDVYGVTERDVPFFLVDCPPLYDRNGLYFTDGRDFPDNHIRFAALSRAALGIVRHVFRPDVIHCHDWQGALVAPYARHTLANDPTFLGAKILLTIHNLGYQGIFAKEQLAEVGLDSSLYKPGVMEFDGDINFLMAGIRFSDAITTVSKGYAREIQTPKYGFRLDGMLRERSDVLTGIVNGVDYTEWNPETDRYIAANYSAADLSGKLESKRDLLTELGLPSDNLERPVIGMVSRLARQKGFDLIEEVAAELLAEDLYFVVLGTGEPQYEELLERLAAEHPGKVAARITYDNGLAHKIEAGSDMFLMPSHYEPCGLNQIYSLRYGTVPVVRATGGLDDTIDSSTGFKFQDYSGRALMETVRAALEVYGSKERWTALMLRGMAKDFSWAASAREYSALYRRLAGTGSATA